jgi:hypothetical protein
MPKAGSAKQEKIMSPNHFTSYFSLLSLARHIFFTDLLRNATDREYIFSSYQMDMKTKSTERYFDILLSVMVALTCFLLLSFA